MNSEAYIFVSHGLRHTWVHFGRWQLIEELQNCNCGHPNLPFANSAVELSPIGFAGIVGLCFAGDCRWLPSR